MACKPLFNVALVRYHKLYSLSTTNFSARMKLSTTDFKYLYNEKVKILDSKEAAKIIGASVSSVREYAQQGLIGQKIGRTWVFTEEELKTFEKPKMGRPRNTLSPNESNLAND